MRLTVIFELSAKSKQELHSLYQGIFNKVTDPKISKFDRDRALQLLRQIKQHIGMDHRHLHITICHHDTDFIQTGLFRTHICTHILGPVDIQGMSLAPPIFLLLVRAMRRTSPLIQALVRASSGKMGGVLHNYTQKAGFAPMCSRFAPDWLEYTMACPAPAATNLEHMGANQ